MAIASAIYALGPDGSAMGNVIITYDDGRFPVTAPSTLPELVTWVATGNSIASAAARPAAYATAFLAKRNWIINGRYNIWQRNTTFSSTGYTADRWLMTLGTGAAVTCSRLAHTIGQTAILGEPQYYASLNRTTTGSTDSTFEQRIEFVRSMAGQTITASWYVSASSGTPAITWNLIQNFGTGGSPSTAIVTNLVTNETITTSFVRYAHTITLPSISGKTIGTNNNNYLSLQMTLPTAAGIIAINIADVQVEMNPVATTFDVPNRFEQELSDCHRFHCKTFPYATVEARNSGTLSGSLVCTGAVTNQTFAVSWDYPKMMRTAPTIITYCPNASSANWTTVSTKTPVASSANIGDVLATIQGTTSVAAGSSYNIHASADAEL